MTCNICVSTFPSVCVCVCVCVYVCVCVSVCVCVCICVWMWEGGCVHVWRWRHYICHVDQSRGGRVIQKETTSMSSFSIYMSTTFALCLCRWRHHSCHVEQSRGSTCMWPNYCGCFWLWWKLRAPRGMSTFSDQCMKEKQQSVLHSERGQLSVRLWNYSYIVTTTFD